MAKAEVKVNGIYVDLDNDFSITIEKNSRLTQFDELIDTWAYNISFPADDSETNQTAFEHAERFEKKIITWQEYPFQFFYNGRLLLNGKLKARYKGGKYEGYAYGMFGAMASADLSKKLNSLTFPEITLNNKAEYTPGTDPYCLFPIYNYYFYQGRSQEIDINGTTIEYDTYKWSTTQFGYQNRFDNNENKFVVANAKIDYWAVITPFMFAGYLVNKVLGNFGIKSVSNVLDTDSLLKQACVYTSFDITKINNQGWVIDAPSGGDWQTGSGITVKTQSTSKYVSTFNPADLVHPEWSVYDFLLGLQNFLNVLFDFSDLKAEARVLDREAIFKGSATDLNHKLLSVPELESEKEKKVVLKFAIDNNDAIWISNDGFTQYKELNDEQRARVKGEKATLALLQALTDQKIGDIWYVAEDYQYREWRKQTNEVDNGGTIELHEEIDWFHLSVYGQPYHVGAENANKTEIESKFGVVNGSFNSISNDMLLTGNGELYKNEFKDFVPRIMLYQGLSGGEPYAPALGGSMDLNWRGTNGLYEKRWKHTTKAVKNGIKGFARFDFNEIDFMELNLNKKFRIEEGAFIIEKTQTTFNLNSINPTQADILKLT